METKTGWFDDLSSRVKQADSSFQDIVGKDVYSFLRYQFNNEAVKVASQASNGNLSEEQIRQGMRGSTAPIAQPRSGLEANQNAISASQISAGIMNYMPYILLGLGSLVAFKFLMKKGK